MKTLITGASGFIGRRLTQHLLEQDQQLHLFCRPASDVSDFEHSPASIFRGSLSSEADVRAAMQGCDRVFHLAAFAGNWSRNPAALQEDNRRSLETLFSTALETGVRRIVYTSTIMVYGPSNGRPITEDSVRSIPADTIYEQLKLESLDIVRAACRRGLDIVVVHPTRVFGPGLLSEANSTTIMIDQYLRGTWRLLPGDGHAAGNYVFVEDIIQGCLAAMERGEAGRHYILGGCNLTFNEFFSLLAECCGTKRTLMHVPRQLAKASAMLQEALGRRGLLTPTITPAWVDVFYGDWLCKTARAERELGYQPTPMREALADTISWLRSSPGSRRKAS